MSKILISNLGNRHIQLNGLFILEYINKYNIPYTFKNFTKFILENYSDHEVNLSLNILNVLLDKRINELSKIYFFTSNQIDNFNQDTLFVGEIVKKLILKNYNFDNVELLTLNCNVVDINRLYRNYKKYINIIKSEHFDKPIIYCDTGGTPQQKFALKILIEFQFDENMIETLNIFENSRVENIEPIEYRKIINYEQVFNLISFGNFDAAFNSVPPVSTSYSDRLLREILIFISNRFNQFFSNARVSVSRLLGQFNSSISDYPEIKSALIDYKNSTSPNGFISQFFPKTQSFKLFELYFKLKLFIKIKDYNQIVLNIEQLLEFMIYAFFNSKLDYVLDTEYDKEFDRLFCDIKSNKYLLNDVNLVREIKYKSKPTLIKLIDDFYISKPQDKFFNFICAYKLSNKYFNPNNSKFRFIDSLRNDLVHNGKGVNEESYHDIKDLENLIKSIDNIFDVDSIGENPYFLFEKFIKKIVFIE